MKKSFKYILMASAIVVGSSAMVSSAYAQINNIAVVSREGTIASSKALSDAYTQIRTTFKTQFDEIGGRENRVVELSKQLDVNNDNRLSQQERDANPGVLQQIEAENTAIENLSLPIALSQMFALQQVSEQYSSAVQQVVTEKNVDLLLAQGSILFAKEGLDLNKEVTNISQDAITRLDTLVPFANTNVPQGWQPDRGTQSLYQQVQQIRAALAQQAAEEANPTPAAQPGTQQQPGR